MKTVIKTKAAGEIIIDSEYIGNKLWNVDSKGETQNYNNHKVKIKSGGLSYSFDFWGSTMNPEIKTDQENVFAMYCSISDAMAGQQSFEDFCGEFGYDEDSRSAEKVHRACEKTYAKVSKVFGDDLYELINELSDDFSC